TVMALYKYEEELLKKVLDHAGEDMRKIRAGIALALRDESFRPRRDYLWQRLERAAKAKIRRLQRQRRQEGIQKWKELDLEKFLEEQSKLFFVKDGEILPPD
ncbi:MAG TPA: hypothetical protein VMV38_00630, partial [Candidatus Paceibacterota bacterium]|nr:hypothetical protein [Candidatus Paceibacterota bacterium]